MSRLFIQCAIVPLLMFAGTTHANPLLKSGPPVGSANDRDGFLPKWVTGPCAGKRVCPV
jgi:hypothetical protein